MCVLGMIDPYIFLDQSTDLGGCSTVMEHLCNLQQVHIEIVEKCVVQKTAYIMVVYCISMCIYRDVLWQYRETGPLWSQTDSSSHI